MYMLESMSYAEKLTTIWLSCQVSLSLYTICAFVAAGQLYMNCQNSPLETNHNWAFLLAWHVIFAWSYSACGTYVMKKRRTPEAVGAIIGIAIALANWTFTIAVLQGSMVEQKAYLNSGMGDLCGETLGSSADSAVILFAVVLMFCYVLFAYLLYQTRVQLFGEGKFVFIFRLLIARM